MMICYALVYLLMKSRGWEIRSGTCKSEVYMDSSRGDFAIPMCESEVSGMLYLNLI